MPQFYDVTRSITTNGSANTLSTHLRALTVANQRTAKIVGLYGSMRSGTAGGAQLRLVTAAVAGSGGTASNPVNRNPSQQAAGTTTFNDATAITAGTTPTTRVTVGLAQTGGMGGWVALEPEHAISLLANAGANGNAEVGSLANATAQVGDITLETSET